MDKIYLLTAPFKTIKTLLIFGKVKGVVSLEDSMFWSAITRFATPMSNFCYSIRKSFFSNQIICKGWLAFCDKEQNI
jgi:hypothetical protein